MKTSHRTVLLFGDVTDPWVEGIDHVYVQAAKKPWIRSFLEDLFSAIKTETKAMDRVLQEVSRIPPVSKSWLRDIDTLEMISVWHMP